MKNKIIIIIIFVLCFGYQAHAAQVILDVSPATIEVGDTITVRVQIDTEGALINVADLTLIYPPLLEVKSISKAGSFVQLWLKEPSYTNEVIFLSGGSPGGILSKNATVASIVFKARAVGDGALGLGPASAVLLNDGDGTTAAVSLYTPTIHIVARSAGKPIPSGADETVPPKQEKKKDHVPPRSFDLVIGNDASLFGGKYFVSFFTADPDSGIDHYEIKEGAGVFKVAQSPYLLGDQKLHTVIHVRAYDNANNYREAVYPNVFKRLWWWITNLIKK